MDTVFRRTTARLPLALVPIALALLLSACAGRPEGRPAHAEGSGPTPVQPATASPAPESPGRVTLADQTAAAAAAPKAPREAKLASEAARQAVTGEVRRWAPPPAPQIFPAPEAEARERYQALSDNPVHTTTGEPVSTFSIDVDTGSYANVRRILNAGQLPPVDAVRVEEMVNYFPYDYARPSGPDPFAVHTEVAAAPWSPGHLLLRVALKGEDRAAESLPAANLVFLVDVSGSMNAPDKLPLLKSALKLLVDRLRPQDRIALVTYAGGTTVVLDSTPGSEHARIANAIDALQAGGSTAGASGIELAYRMARQGFIQGGINRILLATDGDFNVGVTDFRQLKGMVEERRRSGVSLSTLGFGTGNYNEQLMEQIADAGDGAYSYIDTLLEAQKVLVGEMSSTLATIARDVKIQVEFNPAQVSEYRLIGYENRILAREDFNNDQVDAGDVGAGHTVTALYELTPAGTPGLIDPLRYGRTAPRTADAAPAGELAYVKLRYKRPGESASRLIEHPVRRGDTPPLAHSSTEFRFAVAIAGFGQILRGGRYTGHWTLADARALAATGLGNDRFGYRAEALRLMDLASALSTRAPLAVQSGE